MDVLSDIWYVHLCEIVHLRLIVNIVKYVWFEYVFE